MNTDVDLQVWLETQAHSRPEIIVPYVQSSQATNLRYLLRTTISNAGNSSRVSQGGALDLPAHTAVALPRLAVTSPSGECRIELVLTERTGGEKRYEFDCEDARTGTGH